MMWAYIVENKIEVIIAVVLTAAGILFSWWIAHKYSQKDSKKESNLNVSQGDTISGTGDVYISKDKGKTTIIKESTVGVVGDNAKIKKQVIK